MTYALILLGGCCLALLVMSGVGRLVYGPAWTRSAAQHRVPGAPVYPWTRSPHPDPHPDVPAPRPVAVPPLPDSPPSVHDADTAELVVINPDFPRKAA